MYQRKEKDKSMPRRQNTIKIKAAGCFLKRFLSHCLFKHDAVCLKCQTPHSPHPQIIVPSSKQTSIQLIKHSPSTNHTQNPTTSVYTFDIFLKIFFIGKYIISVEYLHSLSLSLQNKASIFTGIKYVLVLIRYTVILHKAALFGKYRKT